MKRDFELVKISVDIGAVARHLLGEPVRGMYRFPGERSASIKIYPRSGSFFDFGRGVGGDVIRLWAHIKEIDNWCALRELKDFYGLPETEDRQDIRHEIEQQEKAQKIARRTEKERKRRWRNEVDFWKRVSGVCGNIVSRSVPLSDSWCFAVNQKQFAEYHLDRLCIEGRD